MDMSPAGPAVLLPAFNDNAPPLAREIPPPKLSLADWPDFSEISPPSLPSEDTMSMLPPLDDLPTPDTMLTSPPMLPSPLLKEIDPPGEVSTIDGPAMTLTLPVLKEDDPEATVTEPDDCSESPL